MPKKKTSAHRTPWTKEDVRELKAHSKARTPLPEIAKKMKNVPRRRCGERRGFSALVSAITAELCLRGSHLASYSRLIYYPQSAPADFRRASRERAFAAWREISKTGATA